MKHARPMAIILAAVLAAFTTGAAAKPQPPSPPPPPPSLPDPKEFVDPVELPNPGPFVPNPPPRVPDPNELVELPNPGPTPPELPGIPTIKYPNLPNPKKIIDHLELPGPGAIELPALPGIPEPEELVDPGPDPTPVDPPAVPGIPALPNPNELVDPSELPLPATSGLAGFVSCVVNRLAITGYQAMFATLLDTEPRRMVLSGTASCTRDLEAVTGWSDVSFAFEGPVTAGITTEQVHSACALGAGPGSQSASGVLSVYVSGELAGHAQAVVTVTTVFLDAHRRAVDVGIQLPTTDVAADLTVVHVAPPLPNLDGSGHGAMALVSAPPGLVADSGLPGADVGCYEEIRAVGGIAQRQPDPELDALPADLDLVQAQLPTDLGDIAAGFDSNSESIGEEYGLAVEAMLDAISAIAGAGLGSDADLQPVSSIPLPMEAVPFTIKVRHPSPSGDAEISQLAFPNVPNTVMVPNANNGFIPQPVIVTFDNAGVLTIEARSQPAGACAPLPMDIHVIGPAEQLSSLSPVSATLGYEAWSVGGYAPDSFQVKLVRTVSADSTDVTARVKVLSHCGEATNLTATGEYHHTDEDTHLEMALTTSSESQSISLASTNGRGVVATNYRSTRQIPGLRVAGLEHGNEIDLQVFDLPHNVQICSGLGQACAKESRKQTREGKPRKIERAMKFEAHNQEGWQPLMINLYKRDEKLRKNGSLKDYDHTLIDGLTLSYFYLDQKLTHYPKNLHIDTLRQWVYGSVRVNDLGVQSGGLWAAARNLRLFKRDFPLGYRIATRGKMHCSTLEIDMDDVPWFAEDWIARRMCN